MVTQTESYTGGEETVLEDRPEGETQAQEEDEELSTDQIFHLLQNYRRRLILKYLQGRDGRIDMREVVENVAAEEYGTTVEALKSGERQRVYIALYQSHLPKLADAGVIEYNRSRGIIERTERADIFDRYLTDEETDATAPMDSDADEGSQRPWHDYYLYAATGGALLFAGGALGILPVSGFVVAAVAIAAFGLLACAHRISDPLASRE